MNTDTTARIASATLADAKNYEAAAENLMFCVDFLECGSIDANWHAIEALENRFDALLKEARDKANALRAIAKYGEAVCLEAYALSHEEGDSTISHYIPALKGHRAAANAAINAGRYLATTAAPADVPTAAAAVLAHKNWTGHTLAQLIEAGRISRTDRATLRDFVRAALGSATLETLAYHREVVEYITTNKATA